MPFAWRACSLILCVVAALLGGCNQRPSSKSTSQSPASQAQSLKIALVCSDLGLGDGAWVRECDAELDALDRGGTIEYLRVGDLPKAMITEAGEGDVGFPTEGGISPGDMTVGEATLLLEEVPTCDWLVLTSPLLLTPALERIAEGELVAAAVLVMDEQGLVAPSGNPPVPVYRFRYDIRHIAFLTGVAAANSSLNGHVVVLVADNDPQADEFFNAARQGVKYDKNNAWVEQVTLHIEPETGIVSGQDFINSMNAMMAGAGSYFAPTDYIVATGRTTPSVMYALTSNPTNGFVQGAYADYNVVRPAKVVGCGLKKPGAALAWVIDEHANGQPLNGIAVSGVITVGIDQHAIGYTSFAGYQAYNPDGIDIEQAVNDVYALIQVNELGIDY